MSIVFFLLGGLITFLLDGSLALSFIGGLVSAVLAVCIDMRNKLKNHEAANKNTTKSDD